MHRKNQCVHLIQLKNKTKALLKNIYFKDDGKETWRIMKEFLRKPDKNK